MKQTVSEEELNAAKNNSYHDNELSIVSISVHRAASNDKQS